ncbi:MAG TPA: substrate-binding domain-containing protein [Verrucomicrobiae bacterium]|nr:substrate-binding domain-containing protein [Verrucomicrobiae bacterium]
MILHRITRAAACCALVFALGGANLAPVAAAGDAPVNVGIINSTSGALGAYGQEYDDGFAAGLAYATHGTGEVNGHKIVVSYNDDAGDGAKAVATAKDLIGQGTKIIAGTVWSGIALQMAPLAQENNILYISGPAAIDGVTGANRNTFRSGRQTYQDVLSFGTVLGTNLRGKSVLVLAQDSAFGQANVAAARAVLGAEGATVNGLLVPLSANDFTPFAQKVIDAKPDLLFVAWAGVTGGALFKSLEQSGAADQTKIATGLPQIATYPYFGDEASKIAFISLYVNQCCHNPANDFMIDYLKKEGKVADLFDADGFVAAEMIVHAVQASGDQDVNKMISSLQGWKFMAPKGEQEIRAADHAMLQPMFIVKLVGSGKDAHPVVLRTLTPLTVAPPVHPFH